MGQRDQRIDVQQVPHGKSSRAARTSSLVTLVSAGDCVMRKPDFGWVTKRGCADTGRSGVSTMECPCTWHTNLTPGRRCRRIRACLGRTTCPLLESVAIMPYCLTTIQVSQAFGLATDEPVENGAPFWLPIQSTAKSQNLPTCRRPTNAVPPSSGTTFQEAVAQLEAPILWRAWGLLAARMATVACATKLL